MDGMEHNQRIDLSKRVCLICGSNTTYKCYYERWYKYKDGYICQKCYKVVIKHNKMIKVITTDSERFWSKVDKKGEDECWEWLGSKIPDGYGNMKISSGVILSHRFCYELTYGKVPRSMCVCHTCDNPPCCNPKHLFLGTRSENTIDMYNKGRGVNNSGENHGGAILTKEQVNEIRKLRESNNLTYITLANKYGVSEGHISKIITNKKWCVR